MIRYSVIIPVYKAEKYLKECVESILLNKRDDIEVILVDDGSPDGSPAICDEYAKNDARVRVIHKENGGVSSARNLGIESAHGEYIVFVDSDDFVDIRYFDVLDEGVASGADLFSFGSFDYVHKADGSIKTTESMMNLDAAPGECSPAAISAFVTKSFFASSWNKVFRVSIIKENDIRFPLGVVCYEDYIFCIKYLSHASSFVSTSTPVYYYRQDERVDQVAKRSFGERFDISRRLCAATEDFIVAKGGNSELFDIRRYVYSAYLTECRAALALGKSEAISAICEALGDDGFVRAIRSIKPMGKTLSLVSFALRLGAVRTAAKIVYKRIL